MRQRFADYLEQVRRLVARHGRPLRKVDNWKPFAITDGRLITGQNPASSTSAAQALLKLLKH